MQANPDSVNQRLSEDEAGFIAARHRPRGFPAILAASMDLIFAGEGVVPPELGNDLRSGATAPWAQLASPFPAVALHRGRGLI